MPVRPQGMWRLAASIAAALALAAALSLVLPGVAGASRIAHAETSTPPTYAHRHANQHTHRYADQHTHEHADQHAHEHPYHYADGDIYQHGHANAYLHAHCHLYGNAHRHSHGHPDHCSIGAGGGTPSATPALMRASTTVEPSPQGTPAAAVQSQSSSPTGVTGLPKAGDGGTGPLVPWGSMSAAVIIVLVGAGSWVLYYGLREATPGD